MLTSRVFPLIYLTVVLAVACATANTRVEDDIAAQIKLISSNFPASISRSGNETSYLLYMYAPARGYQNTVTLKERPRTRLIIAAIYERKGAARAVTLLVDEGADGRLDYTVSAVAPTTDAALALVRSSHGRVSRAVESFQPLYETLLRDVRDTALGHYQNSSKTAFNTVSNQK